MCRILPREDGSAHSKSNAGSLVSGQLSVVSSRMRLPAPGMLEKGISVWAAAELTQPRSIGRGVSGE